MNTIHQVTISGSAADIAARNPGESMTFSIVISSVDEILSMFPFAGTLEQTKMEAGRILSCFRVEASAKVLGWFEIEDMDGEEILEATSKMKIVPVSTAGGSCEGKLSPNVSYLDIVGILGEPNVEDDPDKVVHSWSYEVNGKPVAIWDYKGSRWSYCGDLETLERLFGEENVTPGGY